MTTEQPAARIAPNWCFIRLKETSFWNLPEHLRPFVADVYGIYAFNRNAHTHCCEFTPSYWLWHIVNDWRGTQAWIDLDDRRQDKVSEEISDMLRDAEAADDSSHYQHVRNIERLITEGATLHEAGDIAKGEDAEDEIGMLCEYWNPNPKF